MKSIASFVASALAALAMITAVPVAAQQMVLVKKTTVTRTVTRLVPPGIERAETATVARFGPFRVLADGNAALVGATDNASPRDFARLLAAYPHTRTLELVEVPGTMDDVANLELGRMIRARGIATLVPKDGSVRSGGVELFLAGATHSAHPQAQFAVHAWMDDDGREATAYAPEAPEHRRYISYYTEMGMDAAQARAFYAMTNSASFHDARWMTGAEMNRWTGGAALASAASAIETPQGTQIAYADTL